MDGYFLIEQLAKALRAKDERIDTLEKENAELKASIRNRKPYENEPLWTSEDLADYFRCKSTNSALLLARNYGIKLLPKSTSVSNSKRPVYLIEREDAYLLKELMKKAD